MIAVAAASGALAMAAPVYADAGADGAAAGSPGAVSGNTVQLPVNVPVNLCGDTVSVVGLLNPAMGNKCVNGTDGRERSGARAGGSRSAHSADSASARERSARNGGGAVASGDAVGSAGVLGGNGLKLPVDLPVNVSGNSVNVVGVGNPSFGNESVNTPDTPETTPPAPEPVRPPAPHRSHGTPRNLPPAPQPNEAVPAELGASASLAHTGADETVPLVAAGALVLAGTLLYRRYRPAAGR
ncbi:chaplin family protein [Streptomyces sp. NPDC008150]|uniref:chaplin n=1 Tax=Streptomyces sp. NPDC008150 TaxID=3364816 RepID=UPI0036E23E12